MMHPLRLQRKRVSKRNAKTKLLADSPPSVVTDTGRDPLAKDTRSKEGIFGSRARGCRSVLTHSPEDPKCDSVQGDKIDAGKMLSKPTKRVKLERVFHSIWRRHHSGSHNSERGKLVEKRTQTRFDCSQKQENHPGYLKVRK